MYCNKCIQTWKQRSDTCPTCRSTPQSDPKFELFSDRNVCRQINSLLTFCSNASEGCDAKVELSQLEQHLNSKNGCKFQNTDCSYGCGKRIPRHGVPYHQRDECPLRPSTCKYCKIKSTHQDISGDHAQVCLLLPLPCPNKCGKAAIPRRDLPAHQGVCPREKVDCPFQQLGCKEKLLHKDLARHEKQNMSYHLKLTCTKVTDLGRKNEELERKNEELDRKTEELERKNKELEIRNDDMDEKLKKIMKQLKL